MQTITRAAAKAAGLKTYYTGKACPKGHVVERQVGNSNCVCCANERHRQYRAKNAEALREYNQQYRAENKDAANERKRQYAANNPHKITAKNAKRRAAKIQRTPSWLSKNHFEQIEEFYQIAQMFRTYTGQDYHVDHIIPLQGKTVSGLHAPWNLQVLPAKENISKGNR
jgi:hypothetical protein